MNQSGTSLASSEGTRFQDLDYVVEGVVSCLGRRVPYVDQLLALEPNFTVERFGQVYPIKYDCDREHYMKGLRLAGVPER